MWKSDKPVLSFLKNGKGLPRVILLIALGILLLWLGSGKLKTAEPPDRSATEELCENVQSLVEHVAGVGDCRVYITFSQEETTVYQGSHAVSVIPPKVLAVTVVCEGAEREDVRITLVTMLSSLLDVGTNRVTVEKMK